jgi:hypothetical protein
MLCEIDRSVSGHTQGKCLKSGYLMAEPGRGTLVQMILEGGGSGDTSGGVREVGQGRGISWADR